MNDDRGTALITLPQQVGAAAAQKRPREIHVPNTQEHAVRSLIAQIHASLTTKQRLAVVRRIQVEILRPPKQQHNNNTKTTMMMTDWFIELGGLRIILLQLGLVLDRHAASTVHEIHSLCQVLDDLLRKSSPSMRDTILEIMRLSDQGSAFYDPTTTIQPNENMTAHSSSSSSTLQLLERASRVWEAPQIPSMAHWISACATGTRSLLNLNNHNNNAFRNPGRTGGGTCCCLVRRMIQLLPHSQVLGMCKNISYFDRQGQILAVEPTFLQQLSRVSSIKTITTTTTMPATTTCPRPSETTMTEDNNDCTTSSSSTTTEGSAAAASTSATIEHAERLSAIWRNLALIHDVRIRLKQEVDILSILYTLATETTPTTSSTSSSSSSSHTVVHRNVLNTVILLSMDQDFCISFLLYGDGLYTKLMQCFLTCPDGTTRKRAARTIRLWASHGSSANLLVQSSPLMGTLSAAAVRDEDAQVRHEAAEAFGRCASWIQSPMPQHHAVLQALTQLCQSAPPAIVARAIKGQTALANNRTILPDNPILVEALVNIAAQAEMSILVREDACTALLHLTSVPANRSRLLSKQLLDALCLNVIAIPAATEIVVHLAVDPDHRPALIHHDQLLKALIRCATQPEHPLKQQLKQTIVQLVHEL